MLNATARRERAREWLSGSGCVYGPSVYDPLSAKIAEDVGFEMGVVSAPGVEWVVTGGAELGRVTITELADTTYRIFRSSNLSLLITGPFGFGNALNEIRACEELEHAGASILTIGDQQLPMRFGHAREIRPFEYDLDLEPQVSTEEATAKIRAAVHARQDPATIIAARTNAFLVGNLDAAAERCAAYERAGADAIWFSSATRERLEAVRSATKLPFIVGGKLWKEPELREMSPQAPAAQAFLASLGVRILSMGNDQMRAVAKAYYEAYGALRNGTVDEIEALTITKQQFEVVTGLEQDNKLIREFLN